MRARDYSPGERVRWLHAGSYREGTVTAVGTRYVHVLADVEQRSSRRAAFTRTVSLRPEAIARVEGASS